MSRLTAWHHLATAHVVLCALVLIWNLWVAGRAARVQGLPQALAFLSALGGLLLLPALVVLLVSTSLLTGGALFSVAWIWPATVALVTAQAAYSLGRRRASVPVGVAIVIYDFVLTLIALAHWLDFVGAAPGTPLLTVLAADRSAIAISAQPMALVMPWFLYLPIFAPVTPGRPNARMLVRGAMAFLAAAWTALIVLQIPSAARAVHSYDRYARERLQEHPDSDFVVGVKVFPTLSEPPTPVSLTSDLGLADSIGAGALTIYFTPKGASAATLDSVAHVMDDVRGTRRVIAVLDLSGERPVRAVERESYLRERVADVERIARRLHPDFVVPVIDPNGAAVRAIGAVPVAMWEAYLRASSAVAHSDSTDSAEVRVLAHVGGFGAADSALYAWSASSASPVDAVSVSLYPWLSGAATLDARMRAVDEWARAARSSKPLWVLEAGAFPLAHGEESQARALWGVLAWATSRSAIKGLIAYQASDYRVPMGLRTSAGRLRPAAAVLRRAASQLQRGGS
ncbi:MAG TPA: hypothetical protein VJO52_15235 [Gemmatimonadaceae bacterium]|nr:hypothetical protein [Gemmatimonadaceae bacterium]